MDDPPLLDRTGRVAGARNAHAGPSACACAGGSVPAGRTGARAGRAPAGEGDRDRAGEQHPRDREGRAGAGGDVRGRGGRDVARARGQREHGAHHGRAGDEAEVARQVEHPGDDAPLVRGAVAHDGGVVGRLEDGVAHGDDDDRRDVAGHAEGGRRRQDEGAGRHRREARDRHAPGAEAVGDAPGRHPGQGGHQRAHREDEPDGRRAEAEGVREVERPHHEGRHHHGRDERARRRDRRRGPVRGSAPAGSAATAPSARRGRRGRCRATAADSSAAFSRPKAPPPSVMASV